VKPLLSIQYLRAFAALAVVLFHACQWVDIDFDIGAGGVDLFFVISGFLMWSITQDPQVTPGGFLWKRITRVAPLYWIATLALAALVLVWPALIPQVKAEPAHVLLSLIFIPHLDPAGVPFPLLPPGWSLDYEAILYQIFALALMGPRRWRLTAVLSALVLITMAGLVLRGLFPLFANPLMLEFAAGIVMARVMGPQVMEKGRRLSLGMGWSFIALGLTIFALLKLLGIHSDIGRWLLWGGPAVLIMAGALGVEAAGGLPRSRALKQLGDASYSIYLCHWPIIAVTAKLAGMHHPWWFIPVTVVASLAAGLLTREALEKPLIRLLRAGDPKPVFSVP
jgi:exopolysaccharide production protein ExoZ